TLCGRLRLSCRTFIARAAAARRPEGVPGEYERERQEECGGRPGQDGEDQPARIRTHRERRPLDRRDDGNVPYLADARLFVLLRQAGDDLLLVRDFAREPLPLEREAGRVRDLSVRLEKRLQLILGRAQRRPRFLQPFFDE